MAGHRQCHAHSRSQRTHLRGRFAASPAYGLRELNLNARLDYTSLTDYLNNNVHCFQQTIVTGDDPHYQATVNDLGSTPMHASPCALRSFRWEGQWNPQPPSTVLKPAPLILPSSGTAVSTHRIPNDLKQWQPRVGLAWSPGSKTTLRFSAGLYTALTPATFFHRVFTNGRDQTDTLDSYFDPALIALSGGNTASPHALGFAPAGLNIYHAQIIAMDQNFRNPASLQAAASIEQQRSSSLFD